MTDLFEKSIRTLELPAVLEKLAAKAVSDAAKERCLRLTPATDTQEVLHLLDETDAAKERLGLHGSPSFSGVKDVSAALTRADHGGMLNTRELLDVADVLTASRRVSEYDAQRQGEATVLDRLFSSLHTNRYLEDKIRSAILDEETIADTASSELADIRRKMRLAATKGRQILQRIISSPSYAKVLQEALITQRDGRFVVPVKAECKGSLPGLVHDISSSGATLFVEPMGVVQANNELKELEAREQKEIDRILRQLSAECAAQMENILWDYDILVQLDVIFARAQLSYQLNASRPEVRRRGGITLRRARHPLLDQAKAVPITVELGEQFNTLVITGPNTGGKTVTLKTIGLLSLMAQCGLHIPADGGSAVRVFRRVLADVGDRAEHRAEPVYLLGPYVQHRPDPEGGGQPQSAAVRRVGRRHRPGGGCGSGHRHHSGGPESGGSHRRHHPLCRAENLRHDHGGGGERQLRVRRTDPAAHLPAPHRHPR